MNRRDFIIDLITEITEDKVKSGAILAVLEAEGVAHLGYGEPEVDQILTKFKHTFGNTKTTKYDRFAAHRLAQKYSPQAVSGIIDLLGQKSQEKYAPVVGSVVQLEEKWVSVLNFLRKQDDEVIQL